jgi:predicted naringenin-chalcone synthase
MPTSTVLVVLEALKGEKVLDGMRGWPIAFGQGATTETMLFNSAV